MTNYYTGIGSRTTPSDVLAEMYELAKLLNQKGFVLRSGAAQGADSAFERGADGMADIYLPWPGFGSRRNPRLPRASVDALRMAATVHPAWGRLTSGARALHARNCHQVLGDDLTTPSRFVVCWTPDGCDSEKTRTKTTGGTATAIVLADRHGIPVFNLAKPGAALALASMV